MPTFKVSMARMTKSVVVSLGVAGVVAAAGCGNAPADPTPKTLSVLYAGSMTKVMENYIDPDYQKRTGVKIESESAGSTTLAQTIKSGLKNPDVFISASPGVNDQVLMGEKNGNRETWYVALAADELVLVYTPHSRFAAQLQAAAKSGDWYQVLETPGIRLGRTDPQVDPKGVRAIQMAKLASQYYKQPNLVAKILGDPENPKQVFPEEALLSRLETGQVDVAVAYRHEAVEWGLPFVSLPSAVNLGDIREAAQYASVTAPGANNQPEHGEPIVFTISVPANAPHAKQAADFVKYLLSGPGHGILMKDGFRPLDAYYQGDKSQVPLAIRSSLAGPWNQIAQAANGSGGDRH